MARVGCCALQETLKKLRPLDLHAELVIYQPTRVMTREQPIEIIHRLPSSIFPCMLLAVEKSAQMLGPSGTAIEITARAYPRTDGDEGEALLLER